MQSESSETCNLLKQTKYASVAFDIITIVLEILIAVFLVFRPAFQTSSISETLFKGRRNKRDDDEKPGEYKDYEDDETMRKECQELFYSHIIFMLASFYMCMVVVSWSMDIGNPETIDETMVVWVKIISSWINYFVFLWTLGARKLLKKCRDFDEI